MNRSGGSASERQATSFAKEQRRRENERDSCEPCVVQPSLLVPQLRRSVELRRARVPNEVRKVPPRHFLQAPAHPTERVGENQRDFRADVLVAQPVEPNRDLGDRPR